MSSIMKEVAGRAKEIGEELTADAVARVRLEADEFIRDRLKKMSQTVRDVAGKSKADGGDFTGIDERSVLTFVPDQRSIAGVAPLLVGVFCLIVLPGMWKFAALLFVFIAAVAAFFGYVWQSHIDIPEGFSGVLCHKGEPDLTKTTHTGRNWIFDYMEWIPFQVAAKKDQVVKINVANFTKDFASIKLCLVVAFRIDKPERFAVHTSPAVAMALMERYTNYIALRMITSIEDARVKFTGRDNLTNVAGELNRYMSQYGITVTRVTMPEASNAVVDDLESIRISVNAADVLQRSKPMQLETGIKTVESGIRRSRKQALALAQELLNEGISFLTAVSVAVNARRQTLVIDAQRQITERYSELMGAIATMDAKIAKAHALRASIPALVQNIELRLANIKRKAIIKMLPAEINVLGVSGIGQGVGMGISRDMLSLTFASSRVEAVDPTATNEQVTPLRAVKT